MKNRIVALSIACLFAACATSNQVSPPAADNNILAATAGEDWLLTETDDSGKLIRTVQIEFTDKPGRGTCISGDWKRIRILSDPSHFTRNPVYEFRDGSLQLLLVSGICDGYSAYFFSKDQAPEQGTHDNYGIGGGESVGKVIAKRIR